MHNPILNLNYKNDYYEWASKSLYSTGSPVDHASNDHIVDVVALIHQFVQQKSGEINRVFH